MKEKVSPAVVAVVVVLLLAVIGFIGMKVFGSSKASDDPAMKEKYNKMTNNGTAHPPSQADMMKNPPPGANTNRNRMPGGRPPGVPPAPTGN